MLIIVPVNLYFGFIKTFGFPISNIMKFWVPKVFIGILVLIAQLFNQDIWIYSLMILYGIHLTYFQRNDLKRLKQMLMVKFGLNSQLF